MPHDTSVTGRKPSSMVSVTSGTPVTPPWWLRPGGLRAGLSSGGSVARSDRRRSCAGIHGTDHP